MVGVPRSRGCDTCREQKKKCTVVAFPPCERCSRLGISCVGYGQRRLKFQEEHPNRSNKSSPSPPTGEENGAADRSRSRGAPASRRRISPPKRTQPGEMVIVMHRQMSPSSELSDTLVHCLSSSGNDPRHHLTWTFGDFLNLVPQRLGTSRSLDTAVDAVISGYNDYRTQGKACASPKSLRRYSKALEALRMELSSTDTACLPTTMSAIMIHMIIEVMLMRSLKVFLNIPSLQHSGGAAKILKCRGIKPPKDDLEWRVLMTLRGPVSIQAFFLDESYFTEAEWQGIICGYAPEKPQGKMSYFNYFAIVARLFQRARKALSQEHVDQQELELIQILVYDQQEALRQHIALLGTDDLVHQISSASLTTSARSFSIEHCSEVRDYGMTIMTSIVANHLQDGLCTALGTPCQTENRTLCKKLLDLAPEVSYTKPLGSSWYSFTLSVAYTGTVDVQLRRQMMDVMGDFSINGIAGKEEQLDFYMEKYADFLKLKTLQIPGV